MARETMESLRDKMSALAESNEELVDQLRVLDVRKTAAELAAGCFQTMGAGDAPGQRIIMLCHLFETYLVQGAGAAQLLLLPVEGGGPIN